ncbi:MAG: hypothetical protein R3E32_24090 [Chitinophagales bacterium]
MSYTSRSNRPNEYAHKSNHSQVINDKDVKAFLKSCELPKENENIDLVNDGVIIKQEELENNPISIIITVDGGYTDVEVKKSFPSSRIAFYQFGAFWLDLDDWKKLGAEKPFIAPEDIAKYNDLERIKLVLPSKHITYSKSKNFVDSVRKTLYDFFMQKDDAGAMLIETLSWLIFEEYDTKSSAEIYELKNPYEGEIKSLNLNKTDMNIDFTFDFKDGKVYLTDIFRIHEIIDEELGAGGALGYITSIVEQLIIIHYIRYILKIQPTLLSKILFIRDGSLAFFGQTARLHRPMRKLINFLNANYDIFLVGLEKSGNFVDHAHEITSNILIPSGKTGLALEKPITGSKLKSGHTLLASNSYIYKYIIPGDSSKTLYGGTSYYSGKIIHKSKSGNVYVASLPILNKEDIVNPHKNHYLKLDTILDTLDSIKCDMYDNSLIPVALVNRMVSLANKPSKVLLEKFAQANLK